MNKGEHQCTFCTGDAWNRVVEQAGEFSKREAALWARNNQLARDLKIAEQRINFMTIVLEEEDKKTLPENVIDLEATVKARKAKGWGGGSGEVEDWLSPLNIHAVFWAKRRKDDSTFVLTQYKVVFKGEKARSLQVTINAHVDRGDDTVVVHVDPAHFCDMNDLFEIIRKGDECE